MKVTINKKRYDSDKCEVLGEYAHYNYSNNYSGTTYLLRASDGQLLIYTEANGQDLHLQDAMYAFDTTYNCDGYGWEISDFEMDEDQEERCAELGLIEVID